MFRNKDKCRQPILYNNQLKIFYKTNLLIKNWKFPNSKKALVKVILELFK